MNALITARLSPPVAHRAMTTGHRFTGGEALGAGIVTELATEDEVLERAIAVAEALAGKPRQGLAGIKRGLYGDALRILGG
jgi:enoyl-CoA hydratase/carnithine racemase